MTKVQYVTTLNDFIATPFRGEINAICWTRNLVGDFSEIVNQLEQSGNISEIDSEDLIELKLSEQGNLAREILLKDLNALKSHGASPVLNLIKCYNRDDSYPFFPTDVYSFHVDRSPVPTETFLCTYHGDSSEILPNSQAKQKVLIPEIRAELKKLYHGTEERFDDFLSEHFFDLHYEAQPEAEIVKCGNGHIWKLAVDHPEINVPPCIHRAPEENDGQSRLLLIC